MSVLVAGCTVTPSGPSQLVMPNQYQSFDRFQADDAMCRRFADQSVNGSTPNTGMMTSGALSAFAGAALGAAAGGAWGGAQGALAGAGTGVAAGGMFGVPNTRESSQIVQQRYDNGYIQCMYSHGHQVPIYGYVPLDSLVPAYPAWVPGYAVRP